ncbi:MAG: mismatch-specific DNA-glycosylase [Myxococcota bacterium]
MGRFLPDRLCPSPRILFVGINPSPRSAALKHHYAGRGNPFWKLMHASGLIPEPLTFEQDAQVVRHGLALTNLVDRPTRAADELTREEQLAGRARLERLIRRLEPETVALVGASIYRLLFGSQATPGCGLKPQTFAGARVFVLPNPSGRNAAYPGFAHKLLYFQQLARLHPSKAALRVTGAARRA